MDLFKILKITLLFIYFTKQGECQESSPCPRLFTYQNKSSESDRWYGSVTLLSETTVKGIWLRLIFNKPIIQLGNWLGEVTTVNNKEFIIKNRNISLTENVPRIVEFYIKYNPSMPPPRLHSILLNGKQVCPEGIPTTVAPLISRLQTSGYYSTVTKSSTSNSLTTEKATLAISLSKQKDDEEEEYFPGDFSFIKKPFKFTNRVNYGSMCGIVVVKAKPLVTHGELIHEGEFPWHVALYHARGIDLAYICGASLISNIHIITVAHCITKRTTQIALNPDNLVAYLGKHYLRRFSNSHVQDRQVAAIIIHPQYDSQTYKNDIALVKLSEPAEITDYVRPVCLWQDSVDLNSVLDKEGTVVGWGFNENGKVTEQLMQTKMPVVSQETCIYSFPQFYGRYTSKNTYCAGFRNGSSVCNGDSGGGMIFPKLIPNENQVIWHLRGLVSISVALQNQLKCDSSNYVVFTDVAKHLDWIKNTMLK